MDRRHLPPDALNTAVPTRLQLETGADLATEQYIARWHDMVAPNPGGRRMAAQLTETIAAYAALRGPPPLTSPPSDFAATLLAERDRPAPIAHHPASPLSQIGLAAMRDRLRTGTMTVIQAVDEALARIDSHDRAVNAVLWRQDSQARAQAASLDAAANRSALHGVPLAHKDLFAEDGRPETGGSDFWCSHVAAGTATVLARLAAAGAINLCGLHLAEFAQNPTGQNASYGDCINPWNPARIAGGSSSGSAVAVAMGFVTGSLGTDTGGSIRLPASCCGITGLKPTFGRVSRAGVLPLCASLDCVGPIARTALDCAILMDAIAGPDAADPTSADLPAANHEAALDGDLRGQRIGVPTASFCDEAEPEIHAAFETALAILRGRGAIIVPVEIPLLDAIVAYGGTMARAEAAALHAGWMRDQPQRYVPHVSARLYAGYAIPATYYIEAVQARPAILATLAAELFSRVDAIATPTLRSRAPTRAEVDVDSGIEGTERAFFAIGGNVRPFNYLGLPALTTPCGIDANGVPIGLQLIGRPFAEPRLLRISDAHQRDAGPPPLPTLPA